MINAIKEFLCLTNEEKVELWGKATFIFDTNVLLDLYRSSKQTRETIINAIESLMGRIYMPYQIAYEFMKNRCEIIIDCELKYDEIEKENGIYLKKIKAILLLEDNDGDYINLEEFIKQWAEERKINNLEITSPHSDIVLNKILNLYENKTGNPYTIEQYEVLCKEGEERYKKKLPPGYMDEQKAENIYGDFIIWKEILEYSKSNKKDIIFITRDNKEDWWQMPRKRKIGPRVELNREFIEYTGQKFYIYDLKSFLKFSDGSDSNNEKAISELVKIADEDKINDLNILEKNQNERNKIYIKNVENWDYLKNLEYRDYLKNLDNMSEEIKSDIYYLSNQIEKEKIIYQDLKSSFSKDTFSDDEKRISEIVYSITEKENEITKKINQLSEIENKIIEIKYLELNNAVKNLK